MFLEEAISSLDGNNNFMRRVEINDALKERGIPRWAFQLSFWGFIALFISSNVSAIVESAQTADQLLVFYAGGSCALGVVPACGFYCVFGDDDDSGAGGDCSTAPSGSDSPCELGRW